MGGVKKAEKIKSVKWDWKGLGEQVKTWGKDKASADLLGLNWAVLQGQYYGGERSIKYVTRNSIIACNQGTSYTRIDLPVDHGVETKSNHLPMLTIEDIHKQNISSFGLCRMKMRSSDTQTACVPQIVNDWMQDRLTTSAGQAALLQSDAFTVCNLGGTICVKEVNTTPQESLMAVLWEQYGFDERTIKIILTVYWAIQNKYPNEIQIKRDWRFTRLMGGLEYGLKGVSSLGDEAAWNQTAGKITNRTFKKYMHDDLGIQDDDYEYLQYKVRIQHFMAGYDASTLISSYQSKYLTPMSAGLGITLTEEEAKSIWNQQCNDMCGMTDFAHQQITTATILATAVSKDGIFADAYTGGTRGREQMAGWLGDATLGGDGKTSFGNDDYKVDLDAENIGDMIRSEGYSYIKATEDYYEKRLQEDNRAELFLKKNPIQVIKQLIYNGLILPERTDKISSTRGTEQCDVYEKYYDIQNESVWLDELLKDKSLGGYNFIRSLEAELSDIGDFK